MNTHTMTLADKTENEHNIVMWFKFQIHVICSYMRYPVFKKIYTMFPARIKIEHTHTHTHTHTMYARHAYELKLLISSLCWVEVEVEQMRKIFDFDHAWPWYRNWFFLIHFQLTLLFWRSKNKKSTSNITATEDIRRR